MKYLQRRVNVDGTHARRRGAVVTALTKLAVPRADQDYRRDVGSNPIGAASRRG